MPNYPYLPKGKDIKYVPITNQFMKLAYDTAQKESTDGVNPTGSVVVKDGKVLGKSANKSPLGHFKKFYEMHKNGFCIRRLLKIKTGQKYWACPGCAKPYHHSEQGAIRNAKQNGHDTKGADLYLWGHWWCCKSCWDKMIDAGIKDVYVVDSAEENFKR
ncbi:MAG TPA: deaminase [Candidatus Paceibacterota bacterium]|nr:deaminase [Candidatus Paceibacterota bacterium]HMP18939.1 deaminase [Candidatus Paceibacterota bacterium]HMP85498.1 deaminase [Candidatus Paceibacterota bacterium]